MRFETEITGRNFQCVAAFHCEGIWAPMEKYPCVFSRLLHSPF